MAQGLHQGCVLSPLLFKVFAVIFLVALERFRKNADILEDHVHLQERTAVENWPSNGTGMCAVCYLGDVVC